MGKNIGFEADVGTSSYAVSRPNNVIANIMNDLSGETILR
jgi:hypothetical protein